MTSSKDTPDRWSTRTVEIKVWKIAAALIVLPILTMWFLVVRQEDEILALVRNELVTDADGLRVWEGSFVNTNARTMRDVAVTVNFLDDQNAIVADAKAEVIELRSGMRLELQAPLPPEAIRLRIYSVQWRLDRTTLDRWLRIPGAALMGPFREPWEFGYVMADPGNFRP